MRTDSNSDMGLICIMLLGEGAACRKSPRHTACYVSCSPWCTATLMEVDLGCEGQPLYVLGGKCGQEMLSNKKELGLIGTISVVGIKCHLLRPQENCGRASMDIFIGCNLASYSVF